MSSTGSQFHVDGLTTEKEWDCIVAERLTGTIQSPLEKEAPQIRGCRANETYQRRTSPPPFLPLCQWGRDITSALVPCLVIYSCYIILQSS